MLRKFNFTGRKKIPRKAVSVRVSREEGKPAIFDADFDLSGLKLPGHASVYIEAYHRASYMRFSYGRISDILAPEDRSLTDIEGGGVAQFRLKVIDESADHGQVLAEADGITPFDDDAGNAGRQSILPVKLHDGLGDQIWRVVFDSGDGRPVLELNSKVEGIAQMAKTDDTFLALVHPVVVRIVMLQVLRGANRVTDLDGPADDWRYQWIQFTSSLPGIVDPPLPNYEEFNDESTEQDQLDWIDDVAAAFCTHYKALDRFNRLIAQRGQ